jgi:predicted dehydrogenase
LVAAHGSSKDVELCVCRGRNAVRAEIFRWEFGARVYGDYSEMLRDATVTGVDLRAPNDLHRLYTERAARAGKHVLCEKPTALSIGDAEAMREAAQATGIILMIAHPLRFWPE